MGSVSDDNQAARRERDETGRRADATPPIDATPRKNYRRPMLKEYGSLSRLTRATLSRGTDGATMSMNCL